MKRNARGVVLRLPNIGGKGEYRGTVLRVLKELFFEILVRRARSRDILLRFMREGALAINTPAIS